MDLLFLTLICDWFETAMRLDCDSIATPLVLTSIYLHAILLNAGRKTMDKYLEGFKIPGGVY